MTDLSEIGRALGKIADRAGNASDAMSEAELMAMVEGLGVASLQCSDFLVQRCGDDVARAELQVRRAMDLPPKVLRRRAKEAEEIIRRDELPNIPQHAAWLAIMLLEIQVIGGHIERKQAGAALN